MPDTSDKGGAGGGATIDLTDEIVKATEEYEKAWNEAFAQMENTAQKWADKIEKALEPVKKIFQDFAVGDFFQAGEDVSNLVISITDFFSRAIDNVDWYGIGQKIGDFLAGIDWFGILISVGILIWESINGSIELWSGMFDTTPFETVFLSILALPAAVGFGGKLAGLIVTPFKNVWILLSPIIAPLVSSVEEMFSLWIGGAGTFGESFIAVFGAGGVVVAALAALAVGLGYVFATNEEVRESFGEAISSIQEGLQPAIQFLTDTVLPDLQAGFERFMDILSPIGDFLSGTFTSIWQDMINPALTYIGETVLPKVTETFENLWNNVLVPLGKFLADVFQPAFEILSDILNDLWKDIIIPLEEEIGTIFSAAFEGMSDVLNNTAIPVINWLIEKLQFLWDKVLSPIVDFLWETFKPAFDDTFEGIKNLIKGITKVFKGLIDFITGFFSGNWEKAWEGIKDIFSGIWDGLASIVKIPINMVLAVFEGLANGIIDAWNWIKKQINTLSFEIPDWVPFVGGEKFGFNFEMTKSIKIPRLEHGGITLKHTLAEIGEMNRPEAVLPLTNKRTMSIIADSIMDNADFKSYMGYGEDFVRQIEEATYRGTMRAIQAAGGIKAEATFKVENDRDSIFKITQEESRDFFKRTGKPAYDF